MDSSPADTRTVLELWDYRRRVAELYGRVRSMEPAIGWAHWVSERDELFRMHPQSPLPAELRRAFSALHYWAYNPALRVAATVEPIEPGPVGRIGGDSASARLFGHAHFSLDAVELALPVYWMQDYGGGLFLPFGDATNGTETYGGGRYLLDTAKGADLGHDGNEVILDFNFAYHPSCVHDPRWSCPLPSPASRLPLAIRGGERLG